MAGKQTEVSEMLDGARELLARSLEALAIQQDRVIAKLESSEDYDDKLGSHLAWVAAKVAEVTSSLRQLEKHDRVMSRTPEQRHRLVCAYLRTEASPEQRDEVRALLAELDTARVVS